MNTESETTEFKKGDWVESKIDIVTHKIHKGQKGVIFGPSPYSEYDYQVKFHGLAHYVYMGEAELLPYPATNSQNQLTTRPPA